MKTGIYQIKNILNGKVYIGQAIDIDKRINNHKYYLRLKEYKGTENIHLWRAFQKYGEEAFTFGILTECEVDELTRFEEYYISLIPEDYRYNIREVSNSNKGITHSDESKNKISLGNKGKRLGAKASLETRLKMSKSSKRNNSNGKPVKQIDSKTGDILFVYKSIREAGRVLGISQSVITKVCKKKTGHKTCGGFGWDYIVEEGDE